MTNCGLITITFVPTLFVDRVARIVKLRSLVERFSTARYQSPFRSDRKPLVSTRIWTGLLLEPIPLNRYAKLVGSGSTSRSTSNSAGLFRLYRQNETAAFV